MPDSYGRCGHCGHHIRGDQQMHGNATGWFHSVCPDSGCSEVTTRPTPCMYVRVAASRGGGPPERCTLWDGHGGDHDWTTDWTAFEKSNPELDALSPEAVDPRPSRPQHTTHCMYEGPDASCPACVVKRKLWCSCGAGSQSAWYKHHTACPLNSYDQMRESPRIHSWDESSQ